MSRAKLSVVSARIFRAWGDSREELELLARSLGWTLEELETAAAWHGVSPRWLYDRGLGHIPRETLDGERSQLGRVVADVLETWAAFETDAISEAVGIWPDPFPALSLVVSRNGWTFAEIDSALEARGVSKKWIHFSGLGQICDRGVEALNS